MFNIIYDKLYAQVASWLQSSPKTLCYNMQKLRLTFEAWGKSTTILGKLTDWQHAASALHLNGPVKEVCLWMDSFDVALEGKRTTSRKGPNWSYKKNGPACSTAPHNKAIYARHTKSWTLGEVREPLRPCITAGMRMSTS